MISGPVAARWRAASRQGSTGAGKRRGRTPRGGRPRGSRWWVGARRWLRSRRLIAASVAVLLVLAVVVTVFALSSVGPVAVRVQQIAGVPEPDGRPVSLDSSLYLPARTPAPAIVLAHGFGGSKSDLDSQARSLARRGYVVLTYSARGFGRSGGLIHLDALGYEVADAGRLLDFLQARPEVEHRAATPLIGVAGSSYGGALALMLAATDHRIGAVAADITWNNLATALFPNDAQAPSAEAGQPDAQQGVFKRLWAGYLFSAGFSDSLAADGTASSSCGRFAADICALYQKIAAGGVLDPASRALLLQSSPTTVLAGLRAPALLIQGEQDSLFGLDQADQNALQIAAAGAPPQVRWRAGGHDAGNAGDNVGGWEAGFFDRTLGLPGRPASGAFELTQRDSGISATDGRRINTTLRAAAGYPGVGGRPGVPTRTIVLSGQPQTISAPAGGTPAAVSSIPALGGLLGAAADTGVAGVAGLSRLAGQNAVFRSAPLSQSLLITGSSTVRLQVSSPGEIVLFAALHDLGPDGSDTLPARLVAPIRVAPSADPTTISLRLPGIVASIPIGHRLAVVVSTTDFAYSRPPAPVTYTVALPAGARSVVIPVLPTAVVRTAGAIGWAIAAMLVLLTCGAVLLWSRRGRRAGDRDESLRDVPIVITDLVKEYSDGYRAVDGVSFRVERGQILGLLGPNGAGKTTTLRVLMGLILPTAGTVRVFGDEVVPGSPALAALGAFVEGPGLLPHLSGRENLELYWAASARPVERAQFEAVLEIAGLGASLERRVKTYSHGMQQRLAIAQAMLGLPEVLVLDEPTNGLDPPQIAEMREVLHAYAATGRTVILSSHLLGEVEQTCTHVVVMHRGRLVAAGSVFDVAGPGVGQLVVPDPERATEVLAGVGIRAKTVPARRALEDVFMDLIGPRDD
jgi:ABC-2 type transport system ATP-binding protein